MIPIQETEIDMEKLEKRTMPSLTWKINEEKAEVRGEDKCRWTRCGRGF